MEEALLHIKEAFHSSQNWLAVGTILLLGYAGGQLSGLVRLPSIIGYLVVGVVLGSSRLNLINVDHLGMISDVGLGIVAFMIGTELSVHLMRRMGKKLLVIILAESFGAFLLVLAGIWILCKIHPVAGLAALPIGLVFASMAPASAPAGTVAVIQQYKSKGPLTSLLLAVVGLDDALAIVIYAFAIAAVKMLLGHEAFTMALVREPVIEIIGGLVLGGLLGLLMLGVSILTKTRDHVLTFAAAGIMLATGLANVLGLSLILTNLGVGCVMANLSKHHTDRAYKAVRQITHMVFVLFFVVAGAHLDLSALGAVGVIGVVYIIGRSLGLIGGASFGATVTGAEPTVRKYLGLGILSQAGVAIGLALLVAHELGPYGEEGAQLASLTINTIMATTIFFEILGPITTKIAIVAAGEDNRDDSETE